MALAPYTDPQQVRAALGVSDFDISDITLALPIYSTIASEALYEVSKTLPTDLATTMAIPEADRTAPQQRLATLGGLFATYSVAAVLCTSAPLFALREMKDDRTADIRFDDPFKKLREDLAAMLAFVRARLIDAYLEVEPGAVIEDYVDVEPGVAAPLGVDPVTG